jgi:hypothetical protein
MEMTLAALVTGRAVAASLILSENYLPSRELMFLMQRQKAVSIRRIAIAMSGATLSRVDHVELSFLDSQPNEYL